jgi:DNA-binding GntR family transcriptional regulator
MESIVREIQYCIMVGEFRPKQRLVEAELMGRFSVGRGVIRDSLKILADRGLVSRNENKGAVVVEFSPKQIRDLYYLRSHLEGLAAEMAFDRISAEDIREMTRLQEELNDYSWVDRTLVQLHEAFHEIIFKASANGFLCSQIESLIILAGPIRYFSYTHPEQRDRTLREHEEMIERLKQGEKDRFVRLCREHLIPGMKAYIAIFYPQETKTVARG